MARNEKFKFTYNLIVPLLISILLILIVNLLDQFFPISFSLVKDLLNQSYNNYINLFTLRKYISFPNIIFIILIIRYLLITIIAVVKITDIKSGPLRQKL